MQTMFEPQSLTDTSLQDRMRAMLIRPGEDPEREPLPQVFGDF
jgi:hypothetical protein